MREEVYNAMHCAKELTQTMSFIQNHTKSGRNNSLTLYPEMNLSWLERSFLE